MVCWGWNCCWGLVDVFHGKGELQGRVNNSGNLLTGALRSSLGKEFWKGNPVQEVSINKTCLQATCHLWNGFFFFEEWGCRKGVGGLAEPCFMSCLPSLCLEALWRLRSWGNLICLSTPMPAYTPCVKKSMFLAFPHGEEVKNHDPEWPKGKRRKR